MKRFKVLSKVETILTVSVATAQLNEVVKSQIMGLMKDYAPEGKFSWFGSKLESDTKDFEVSKREYSNGLMAEFTLTKQCGSEIIEIQPKKEEEALFG